MMKLKQCHAIYALLLFMLLVLFGALLFLQNWVRAGLLISDTTKASHIEGKMLIDPAGVAYSLEKPARRIVSATLASDEILESLDVKDRVVGVSFLVDDPMISGVSMDYYPNTITRVRAESESILALHPDMVFVTNFTQPETVQVLMGSRVPVVRLGSLVSFKDTERNLRLVAAAVGESTKMNTIIERMWQTIATVNNKVKNRDKPTVLYYAQDGYTEGEGTFMDEVITLAGGDNVAKKAGVKGGVNISEELAISLQPEVIIMSNWSADNTNGYMERVLHHPLWQNVPAVKNKRVYTVQGSWLISTSQLRVKGVEEVAQLLHPEAFQ